MKSLVDGLRREIARQIHLDPSFFGLIVCAAALALVTAGTAASAPNPAPAHADVSYGPSEHQRLDIYFPPKDDGPYPVVLWFGGIWKPAKHPANLKFFGDARCAVIAVQTRTMTDATK